MGRASRMRRREAKQQAHCNSDDTNLTCSICLETMDKTNSIKLECGHTFHKSCSDNWTKTQIHNQVEDGQLNLMAPLGKVGNHFPILAYEHGEGVIHCAVCRTEYELVSTVSTPKPVIAKVNFAEDFRGIRYTHYITHVSELRRYTPKLCNDYNEWIPLLLCLMDGVISKEDTELYPMCCNCSKQDFRMPLQPH